MARVRVAMHVTRMAAAPPRRVRMRPVQFLARVRAAIPVRVAAASPRVVGRVRLAARVVRVRPPALARPRLSMGLPLTVRGAISTQPVIAPS